MLMLFKGSNIGESAQTSIMKNNDLMIFGKQNIEFHKLTFVESCLKAFQSIFWEYAAVTSMCDDKMAIIHSLQIYII